MRRVPSGLIAIVIASATYISIPVADVKAQCDGVWTQRLPAASPSARSNCQMVFDSARGVMVVFGGGFGDSGTGMNNETWEFDGTSWAQKTPVSSPSARTGYGMAFDSARGVTVLFGGYTQSPSGENAETWEWNGTNWSQRAPATSPSARYFTAMTFDSGRGVSVLFGGAPNGGDETWEWNGASWTKRLPAASPSSRSGHAMVYDSMRGVTLLFGGGNGETWEWNGTAWSQMSPTATPDGLVFPGLAYDSARGISVLFGGGSPLNAETWEWDGTTWSLKSTAPAPSARFYHTMAYDSKRNVSVMFGGVLDGPANSNETWQRSVAKLQITAQPAAQTIGVGQAAVFSVTATGPDPLSYQWRLNGTALTDGGEISGATTSQLIINPASTTNNGSYDCEIGGTSCKAILTEAVALVVDPCKAVGTVGDADGNGVLDSCDAAMQNSAPCGLCGGGAATMMPISLIGLAALRRRKWNG